MRGLPDPARPTAPPCWLADSALLAAVRRVRPPNPPHRLPPCGRWTCAQRCRCCLCQRTWAAIQTLVSAWLHAGPHAAAAAAALVHEPHLERWLFARAPPQRRPDPGPPLCRRAGEAVMLMNGRYGPYVKCGTVSRAIPKARVVGACPWAGRGALGCVLAHHPLRCTMRWANPPTHPPFEYTSRLTVACCCCRCCWCRTMTRWT